MNTTALVGLMVALFYHFFLSLIRLFVRFVQIVSSGSLEEGGERCTGEWSMCLRISKISILSPRESLGQLCRFKCQVMKQFGAQNHSIGKIKSIKRLVTSAIFSYATINHVHNRVVKD